MPDSNGDPTDQEMIGYLGWGNSDTEDTPGADEVVEPAAPAVSGLVDTAGQPIASTPPTIPAPVTPPAAPPAPTTDPAISDIQRQFADWQTQQQQQQQDIQARAAINQDAQQYMNQQLAAGQSQEVAWEMASQRARTHEAQYQNQLSQQQLNTQAAQVAAQSVAQRFGVDYNQLTGYQSIPAMEQAASLLSRVQKMEGQTIPTVAKAPVQQVDSGQAGSPMNREQQKWAYAQSKIDLTEEQFHNLFS